MKKSQINESDITLALKTVADHVRDQVKNSIIEAHQRSIVKGLEENQVTTICNIIESSANAASSTAIGNEAAGLINRIQKEINRKE